MATPHITTEVVVIGQRVYDRVSIDGRPLLGYYGSVGEALSQAGRFLDAFEGTVADETLCLESACRVCGCTDSRCCPGGCWWVDVDRHTGTGLCSACAELEALHG